MRWENVYVAGTGVWLAEPEQARTAVEDGRYDAEQAEQDDLISVCVADESTAPPDMAVQATTTAVKRSGLDAADVGLLIHSGIWFQGVEMWPAASYVAGHALGRDATAFGFQQECNAALGALELAARQVDAQPEKAAVVTTADRFGAPLIKRWSSEPGFVYGDGATALVLSGRGGVARLLSTASGSDNAMEAVVRGAELKAVPTGEPLDLLGRVGHYMRTNAGGFRAATQRVGAVVKEVVDHALADAGIGRDDVARVVVLASGRSRMQWQVPQLLGLPFEKSTWDFARRVGHLGAGDQIAALNHLLEHRQLAVGDRVLMVGGGSGFSCTCAVLEITEQPDWAPVGLGEAVPA
ncbi:MULTISPECIES: ketoacyl-ACP synthase III family protein [unclassified Streptomyces]|uniref:ketoacyl-ACP synthase III family protein n=1 Tax=unclassified Streptomyces TaxID=2593676 RepID=UPI00224CDFFD|nr:MULTISPECIES: ketoacyl-ACP synthase III family protein [unclassified Streptomyces]MCX5141915.1 ketoacyl-ACP synthase III family protein [Streptomyces sp. NBC_00338]WRZ66389.1 ketoacyl-ACP synthase III family protein [Streptomyces sp. NBC_01257]WSU60383.1 ketoacyl-ACP synthase III family protein [Streptomyces sp. NBC_01104]